MSIQAILYEKGENVLAIAPDASVKDAADRLRDQNVAALVVAEGQSILGIVSEHEIVHALSRHGVRAISMTVGDVLKTNVATVAPEDSLKRAMSLMTRDRARHVLVLRDAKLAGIVSVGDIVKHRLEDLELGTPVSRDMQVAAH
jgi:CBS domain-containing protein